MDYKYIAASVLAIPLMGTAFVGAVLHKYHVPEARRINDAMNGKAVGAPLPSRAASGVPVLQEYQPK